MKYFDIFNGDADGICALLQLRQIKPVDSVLVSGIKRDIKLLEKVHAGQGDKLTVLDISLDKNRVELLKNLHNGAEVFYIDHHFCGEIPVHERLKALIDLDTNVCTSLLVNQHLDNQKYLWAITGAFGDNLKVSAENLAGKHQLSAIEVSQLNSLGIYINYNGYGADIDDLHFVPDLLYKKLLPYQTPFDFIQDSHSVFQQLEFAYKEDKAFIAEIKAEYQTQQIAVFILPDESWARRISGIFSNKLVNQFPDRAHAVLSHNKQGGYLISVRAPLNNKTGADELCRQFSTGGGRQAAAGINHLDKSEYEYFVNRLTRQFSKPLKNIYENSDL
ncbi:MAG: DHH family phosphoesterase [gamma proteobacterium symbiont of Taylorina sp.]|nr:DHH family phosphoesterase [gamma proteobacterium symbiont of Taylorina sp.]